MKAGGILGRKAGLLDCDKIRFGIGNAGSRDKIPGSFSPDPKPSGLKSLGPSGRFWLAI
jgi:hypothetical protein